MASYRGVGACMCPQVMPVLSAQNPATCGSFPVYLPDCRIGLNKARLQRALVWSLVVLRMVYMKRVLNDSARFPSRDKWSGGRGDRNSKGQGRAWPRAKQGNAEHYPGFKGKGYTKPAVRHPDRKAANVAGLYRNTGGLRKRCGSGWDLVWQTSPL